MNVLIAGKYFYRAIFKNDDYAKFIISEKLVGIIYPKYKFSEFGRLFLEDNDFINRYYTRFCGTNFHSLDRKFFLNQILKLVKNVDGDTAECGVYLGASSYLICKASTNSNFNKTHYLFDSFEGLSQPLEKDGNYWKKGDLTVVEESVKNNLKDFSSCVFCKGWIPERFSMAQDKTFSFVHIDVDLYQPTLDSLKFFYERLVTGGIMLCDDYGFSSCPGATAAMDEFFSTLPESIVHVPTGQAFIVKVGK